MGSIRRSCRFLLPLALVVATVIVATPLPASASDPLTFVGMIGRARLDDPEGVAANAAGDIYVADTGAALNSLSGDRVVKYSADGTFLDVIAGTGTTAGAVGDPTAVAVAPSGSPSAGAVYVVGSYYKSLTEDGTVLQEFDSLGNYVRTIGGHGTGSKQFISPQGVAVDSLGNVYVADFGNDRIQEFTSSGGSITSWDTPNPTGIAIDSSDVVYVASTTGIARFDSTGSPLSSWGSSGAVGVAIDGSDDVWVTGGGVIKEYDNLGSTLLGTYGSGVLNGPQSITIAPSGKAFVADTGNGDIQRFSSAGVTEIQFGRFPGAGVPDTPTGIAVDGSDNVYVTNAYNDQIQKFDVDGNLLGEFGQTGNGNAEFYDPAALAIGPDGNIYVADTKNMRIQKLDSDGNYLGQWGGYGSGDGDVNTPQGIAVNPSTGNVYVADTLNNRVEEFSSSGSFIRKWGALGTGDGQFKSPKGIAIDGSGNVWVADSGSNKRIQEFTAAGAFVSKFGQGGTGDDDFSSPSDLAFDSEGTIWVVDKGYHRIQRYTTAGIYQSKLGGTVAGLDTGQFDAPLGIAIDSTGRILVADSQNDRVQVFEDKNGPDTTITGPGVSTPSSDATFTLTANEPGATFHCKLDGGSYAPCTGTQSYSGLTEGAHTFYAYATDTLGFDGNPTSYPWTIDTTPPVASFTSTPPDPSGSTSASFSFTSNEGGSTFLCSKDGAAYTSCTSPKSYSSLTSTTHTFRVKAIDQAGNVSAPIAYSWLIDTTPPTVSITAGPTGWVQSTDATFKFTSNDATSYTCKLDGGSFTTCTSPTTYSSLVAGQHTFYVEAVDNLGNTSSPVHRSWTVDLQTHRPDNQIATGTTYAGNNVYNSTGTNQTKTLKGKVGKTLTFKIRIENDGDATDGFTLKGGGTAKGYSVAYMRGTSLITSKVVAGTYTINLAAGESIIIKMNVTIGSNAATSRSITFTTSAVHEPSKLDTVKAVVKRA
jgi:DNA-binding beta-propeller fold protein YncE